ERSGNHGKQREHARQESAKLARGAVRLDKEFHGERLEGKDGRVKSDAESDNVPVAHAKLEQVGEDDLFGGSFAQAEVPLRLGLQDPVNNGSHNAKDREGKGYQEGPAPVGVSGARPGRGVERGERSQPA